MNIRARLKEGSSWAAVSAALGTLGSQVPAPFSYAAFSTAAAAGIAAVLLKDRGDHST